MGRAGQGWKTKAPALYATLPFPFSALFAFALCTLTPSPLLPLSWASSMPCTHTMHHVHMPI